MSEQKREAVVRSEAINKLVQVLDKALAETVKEGFKFSIAELLCAVHEVIENQRKRPAVVLVPIDNIEEGMAG